MNNREKVIYLYNQTIEAKEKASRYHFTHKPLHDGHVFDEEQSVKCNKEKVVQFNEDIKQTYNKLLDEYYKLYESYCTLIYNSIIQELKCSNECAKTIFEYISGRSFDTIEEKLDELENIISLISSVINEVKKGE